MYLLSIFILSLITFSSCEERLVFLLTHFRHGARAPQSYYNLSSHLDYILENWQRPGELTGMGKRMHYLLGLRNRERYIINQTFLSPNFDPHEILIYSSPFNRTLLSVSSHLQGLYPETTGENLTSSQEEDALPQVELSSNIKEIKKKLEGNALPHLIDLAPIRMINNNEKKIILYDIEQCQWKREEIKKKNLENMESLKNIVNNFNKLYAEKFKLMFPEKTDFDVYFIDSLCDAFIAGFTDHKDMKEFAKTGINKTELREYCFGFNSLNFRDWISGDKERSLSTLETSKLMREFIHYMKLRLDADINKENISEKTEDYSRPKMMMISAHDSTISAWEIFFAKIFDENNVEHFYRYPKFATQIAFEVVTDKPEPKSYSDYTLKYYFNDELVFEKNVVDFIQAVEPQLWSDEKINEFCGFDKTEDDDEKNLYFILMILFSCLSALFLIAIIILVILLKNKIRDGNNRPSTLLKSSVDDE